MQPRAACRSREYSYSVAFRDGCCDNDDRLVAPYRSQALRIICLYGRSVSGIRGVALCSRGRSYLVALSDGCCDNDDRLVATYRSHALRNICLYGRVSGSRGVALCSRRRSYFVALSDGRCDNNNATFESITFSYIGILCGIYNEGVLWQS